MSNVDGGGGEAGPNVTQMPHRWLLLGCCLAAAGGWETEKLPIFVTF